MDRCMLLYSYIIGCKALLYKVYLSHRQFFALLKKLFADLNHIITSTYKSSKHKLHGVSVTISSIYLKIIVAIISLLCDQSLSLQTIEETVASGERIAASL